MVDFISIGNRPEYNIRCFSPDIIFVVHHLVRFSERSPRRLLNDYMSGSLMARHRFLGAFYACSNQAHSVS